MPWVNETQLLLLREQKADVIFLFTVQIIVWIYLLFDAWFLQAMKIEEFVSQIEDMKSQIASLQKTKKPLLVESATHLSDLHKVSPVTLNVEPRSIV